MGTANLIDYLMRIPHLLLACCAWFLISLFVRLFPRVAAHPYWARVAPVLPLALCSVGVWIPGVVEGDLGAGSRVLLGIVLGALAANGHKIFGQTVLGKDERIK